jgi:anti-sigma B factor antagonist
MRDGFVGVQIRHNNFRYKIVVCHGGTMALSIKIREAGTVTIMDLAGRLWVLEQPLRQKVADLIEQGKRRVVLNLAEVNYIDSSGLGQMISIWSSIRSRNGHIVVLHPNQRIRRLLDITKLDTVFDIFGEEGEAVKAVQAD